MTFTENDKMKALAIVHVFETSKPFGDYAACVVLNDGAGVSYGINQFTHRSGSLAAVVREYLANGGQLGREIFNGALPLLAKKTPAAIERLASDALFKRTLKTAAITREMKAAQRLVAYERYLRPAIEICERMRFVTPLSLAVAYDSVTHGSWELISARVGGTVRTVKPDRLSFEKSWITEYVRARHRWLTEIRRLRVTNYRTKFFLDQIAIGNWDLRLPVTVHGLRLREVEMPDEVTVRRNPESEPGAVATAFPAKSDDETTRRSDAISEPEAVATGSPQPEVKREQEVNPSILTSAGDLAMATAEKFDRVDGVITAVATRKDAAKSLWTTVAGTLSQAIWGVFGFLVGLPRIVWITVAIIAGSLMLLYLYRQITLGKIRERLITDN
ncbi:MAG: chitosanase [Pyrinomonadaceae bacterium]